MPAFLLTPTPANSTKCRSSFPPVPASHWSSRALIGWTGPMRAPPPPPPLLPATTTGSVAQKGGSNLVLSAPVPRSPPTPPPLTRPSLSTSSSSSPRSHYATASTDIFSLLLAPVSISQLVIWETRHY